MKVFLKNGQEADLVKEMDGQYLVDPYMVYSGYEGEEGTEPSGALRIVNEIFKVAPVEVINKEYLSVLEKIAEKSAELKKLTAEVHEEKKALSQLRLQTTDLNKCLFDLSQYKSAKRLTFFKKGEFAPTTIEDQPNWSGSKGAVLGFKITAYTNEIVAYGYSLDYDGRKGYSNNDDIDPEFGIKVDLSDNEILELALARNAKIDASSIKSLYVFRSSNIKPEPYLSTNLLQRIKELEDKEKEGQKNSLERQINEAKEKLKQLNA